MNEEEAIERRILDAYLCGKISKKLYYELEGVADILKAVMDEKISKKLYFALLGCEKT